MSLTAQDILLRPRVTEKSVYLASGAVSSKEDVERRAYTFQVHVDANKPMVKAAVEELFSVKVANVAIHNRAGKSRRRQARLGNRVRAAAGTESAIKIAIVTLQDGQNIEEL